MNDNTWEWTLGKVNTKNRYFELKFGFEPTPVARIGLGDNKIFVVEFLPFLLRDIEHRKEILAEIIYEIELYLINNSEPDPVDYMIRHTRKCANTYSRVHWGYFPRGAKNEIKLSKKNLFNDSESFISRLFSKLRAGN